MDRFLWVNKLVFWFLIFFLKWMKYDLLVILCLWVVIFYIVFVRCVGLKWWFFFFIVFRRLLVVIFMWWKLVILFDCFFFVKVVKWGKRVIWIEIVVVLFGLKFFLFFMKLYNLSSCFILVFICIFCIMLKEWINFFFMGFFLCYVGWVKWKKNYL